MQSALVGKRILSEMFEGGATKGQYNVPCYYFLLRLNGRLLLFYYSTVGRVILYAPSKHRFLIRPKNFHSKLFNLKTAESRWLSTKQWASHFLPPEHHWNTFLTLHKHTHPVWAINEAIRAPSLLFFSGTRGRKRLLYSCIRVGLEGQRQVWISPLIHWSPNPVFPFSHSLCE